jgi:hypothetical protein
MEYCQYKFNQTADPSITNDELLACYAFEGVEKGEEYCELTFSGSDNIAMA